MSEKHKAARKAYWASIPKEERIKKMIALASGKQKKMTFTERRAHALVMVAARRRRAKEKKQVLKSVI